MVRRIDGALAGQLVEQYAGGAPGRASAIDALATQEPGECITRASDAANRLDALFNELSNDAWSLTVRTVKGGTHAVERLPFRRWREVEVHLVDLDVGVELTSWPDDFIDLALPRLIAGLADRTDRRELTAWLLGRATPPDLPPWA